MNVIDELTKERDNLAKDLARCYEELQATQKEVKLLERALYRTRKQRYIWKRVADRYIKKCEELEERERDNRSIIDWGIKRVKRRDDESAQKALYIFGCDMSAEYQSEEKLKATQNSEEPYTMDMLCDDSPMLAPFRYFLDLQTEKDDVEDKAEFKCEVLRDYTERPVIVKGVSYKITDNADSSKKPSRAICDIVDKLKGLDVCTDRAHCPYRDIFNS